MNILGKKEAEKVIVDTSMRQLLLDQSRDDDAGELTASRAITKESGTTLAGIAAICKPLDRSLSSTATTTLPLHNI